MASLVPQGYPGGMDVMVVTEIRDPRERLDQRDLQGLQDRKEQRENLVLGALSGQKGEGGLGISGLMPHKNWKECAWKDLNDDKDNGLIKVHD